MSAACACRMSRNGAVPPSVSLAQTGMRVERAYSVERRHVAHLDRILRPERAILLERPRDPLGLVQIPQRVELGHDLDAIAHRLADLAKRLQRRPRDLRAEQETAVAALGERIEGPDLHRGVAFGQQALRQLVGAMHECDLIVVRPFGTLVARRSALTLRRATRAGVVVVAGAGVVGADAIAALPAQQLADRLHPAPGRRCPTARCRSPMRHGSPRCCWQKPR